MKYIIHSRPVRQLISVVQRGSRESRLVWLDVAREVQLNCMFSYAHVETGRIRNSSILRHEQTHRAELNGVGNVVSQVIELATNCSRM